MQCRSWIQSGFKEQEIQALDCTRELHVLLVEKDANIYTYLWHPKQNTNRRLYLREVTGEVALLIPWITHLETLSFLCLMLEESTSPPTSNILVQWKCQWDHVTWIAVVACKTPTLGILRTKGGLSHVNFLLLKWRASFSWRKQENIAILSLLLKSGGCNHYNICLLLFFR